MLVQSPAATLNYLGLLAYDDTSLLIFTGLALGYITHTVYFRGLKHIFLTVGVKKKIVCSAAIAF